MNWIRRKFSTAFMWLMLNIIIKIYINLQFFCFFAIRYIWSLQPVILIGNVILRPGKNHLKFTMSTMFRLIFLFCIAILLKIIIKLFLSFTQSISHTTCLWRFYSAVKWKYGREMCTLNGLVACAFSIKCANMCLLHCPFPLYTIRISTCIAIIFLWHACIVVRFFHGNSFGVRTLDIFFLSKLKWMGF